LFGLTYFWVCVKQLMQINKLVCSIIIKFFNVVYEKTTYKDATFVNKNTWINIEVYLFA
jgi:hypothetical protein